MDKVVLMKTRGEEYQKLLDEQEEKIHEYEEKYLSINMEIARIGAEISEQYEMLLSSIKELHTNNITETIGEERGNKDELWHAISECLGEYKIELVNKYRKIGTSRPRKREELIPIVKSYYETQQKIDQLTREKISVQRAASHSAEYEELIHSLKERQYVTPEEFKKVWSILIQQFPALDEECEGVLSASYAEIKGLIDEKKSLPDIEKLKQEYTVERETFLKKVEAEFQSIKPTTVSEDYSIGIRDNFDDVTEPPEQLCIGKYTSKIADCELASILASEYQIGDNNPLILDLKNKGNILINASQDDANNETLYHIVCGLIMRYLEAFPLGDLNVHIYDPNESGLFTSLKNGFAQNESPGCSQIIDNGNGDPTRFYKDLSLLNDTHCKEVLRNLIGETRDLYDLYNSGDRTHAFHLYIIRGAFSDIVNSHDKTNVQRLVNLITNKGVKCGIRFIIVNDSDSVIMHDNRKQFFDDIENYVTTLDFRDDNLYLGGLPVEVSMILNTDSERFIEERAMHLSTITAKRTNKIISYEDIGFGEIGVRDEDKYSHAISIPVGKIGTKILEILFNCGDEKYGPRNTGAIILGGSNTGKSSLFNSLVINGCMKYSPDDVQFWLLDFKDGANGSNYLNANIPHIDLLSKNNTIDDAYCLLNLLAEERVRRTKLLGKIGLNGERKETFKNIAEYNEYVDSHPDYGPSYHLSRIIVVIDEAQGMFIRDTDNMSNSRDDNDTINNISKLIYDITVKGRFVGLHLVMFAQDLNSKASLLKENFVQKVLCQGIFNVSSESSSCSDLSNNFKNLKDVVSILHQGECYITCNGDKLMPDKAKIAYSSELNKYFSEIREKYNTYTPHTRIIGETMALSPSDSQPRDFTTTYQKLVGLPEVGRDETTGGNHYSFVFGEDAYTLDSKKLTLTTAQSSVCAYGTDTRIMSSICGTLLISASNLKEREIYVCNGFGPRETIFNTIIKECKEKVVVNEYMPKDIDSLIAEIYAKLNYRRELLESGEIVSNPPIFVIINNITNITKIQENMKFVQKEIKEPAPIHQERIPTTIEELKLMNEQSRNNKNRNCSVQDTNKKSESRLSLNNRMIMDVISEIATNGPAVEIYFNIVTRDLTNQKLQNLFKVTSNKIFFNNVSVDSISIDSLSKQLIRSILNSVRNDVETGETFVVSVLNNKISKVRPILY